MSMKPGGSEGGEGAFVLGAGLVLCALGIYLFFDSVRVTSGGCWCDFGPDGARGWRLERDHFDGDCVCAVFVGDCGVVF